MMNNIVLVGRTTRNMELKENQKGTHYVSFTLAVNRPYKDEQRGQQADFIPCMACNKTAETLSKYVSKGNMIGIEGRLQIRSYESEAGVRQYISEVLVNRFTFLESKKSSTSSELIETFNPQQGMPNYDHPFATATTLAGAIHHDSVRDEELPF